MSDDRVRGVVLTHATLAAGLIDAVQAITGEGSEALVGLSNTGLSPQVLLSEVRRLTDGGPTLIFTDLPSGSCNLTARRLSSERDGIMVISGVNLPLLLDFVHHRHLPLTELGPRLVERGRTTITLGRSGS